MPPSAARNSAARNPAARNSERNASAQCFGAILSPSPLRHQVPFGIAQIGKAFRNEITPRNFIFRVREFEQMELEFFVEPGTDEQWHEELSLIHI